MHIYLNEVQISHSYYHFQGKLNNEFLNNWSWHQIMFLEFCTNKHILAATGLGNGIHNSPLGSRLARKLLLYSDDQQLRQVCRVSRNDHHDAKCSYPITFSDSPTPEQDLLQSVPVTRDINLILTSLAPWGSCNFWHARSRDICLQCPGSCLPWWSVFGHASFSDMSGTC